MKHSQSKFKSEEEIAKIKLQMNEFTTWSFTAK